MIIDAEQYIERPMKISMVKINILGIILIIAMYALTEGIYYLLWHKEFETWISLWGFIAIILGLAIHELIHGITAAIFSERGWKSIKFGVMWQYLAPYCHCKEPLPLRNYRLVVLMPSIMALVIWATALIFNWHTLLVASTILIVGGCGDYMVFYKLRNESSRALVYDYPDTIGGAIFEPKDEK